MAEKKKARIRKKKERVSHVLKLAEIPILDVSEVDSLKEVFIGAVKECDVLLVEAQNVERITTPCVQVFLAAAYAMRKKRGRFILQASQSIEESMCLLGLKQTLIEWNGE